MKVDPSRFSLRLGLAAAFLAVSFGVMQPAHAGTGDNVDGWAWSASIGWIAMNCTDLADCTHDFGVTITTDPLDNSVGNLHGYAWSATLGWVCFGSSCAGNTPEGAVSYAKFREDWNGKENEIYGWAQVVSMGPGGWISLNCDRDNNAYDICGASNFRTVINMADGRFTLGAFNDHWAWGANNEGTGVGWVDLSLVKTSWVAARFNGIIRPAGIYEPQTSLPGFRQTEFDITFTDFWATANDLLQCRLKLPDGSRRSVSKTLDVTLRGGVTTLTYAILPTDPIDNNSVWIIEGCRIATAPISTACASDANCVQPAVCDTAIGKCRPVVKEDTRRLPVYVHTNNWGGLVTGGDQNAANRCFAGFPGEYFRNDAQCDLAGDASYAMLMRRGMPVELNCNDGIDNDGNGRTDCADSFCLGISYFCDTRPRTPCIPFNQTDGLVDCNDATYESGALCCSNQPFVTRRDLNQVVNGLECRHGDLKDGYFDCECDSSRFDQGDCYAPGATVGSLCCSSESIVTKK